jgi:hypothetical protein
MKKSRNALKMQKNGLLGQVKVYFFSPKNTKCLKSKIFQPFKTPKTLEQHRQVRLEPLELF